METEGKMPVIDISRLTEMIGDDVEVLNELFALFKDSLLRLREQLKQDVQARGNNLKSLAHELKGSASNMGASSLAALGELIEIEAEGRDWARIEQLAAEVDQEISRVMDFVERYGNN
jgi:HPt (histidine-containing phosphotransfer) domain-containing protein